MDVREWTLNQREYYDYRLHGFKSVARSAQRMVMNRPMKIVFDATHGLGQKTGVGYLEHMLIAELAKNYPKDLI